MPMVQIRNMPDELHRRVKSKAALRGMSLSDYLLRLVERDARTLGVDEINAALDALPTVADHGPDAADLLHEARDERHAPPPSATEAA